MRIGLGLFFVVAVLLFCAALPVWNGGPRVKQIEHGRVQAWEVSTAPRAESSWRFQYRVESDSMLRIWVEGTLSDPKISLRSGHRRGAITDDNSGGGSTAFIQIDDAKKGEQLVVTVKVRRKVGGRLALQLFESPHDEAVETAIENVDDSLDTIEGLLGKESRYWKRRRNVAQARAFLRLTHREAKIDKQRSSLKKRERMLMRMAVLAIQLEKESIARASLRELMALQSMSLPMGHRDLRETREELKHVHLKVVRHRSVMTLLNDAVRGEGFAPLRGPTDLPRHTLEQLRRLGFGGEVRPAVDLWTRAVEIHAAKRMPDDRHLVASQRLLAYHCRRIGKHEEGYRALMCAAAGEMIFATRSLASLHP